MDSNELLQPITCPDGNVVGLIADSSGLKDHFEDFLSIGECFLDGDIRPYSLKMNKSSWMISTPEAIRISRPEMSIFDHHGNVLGCSPDADCVPEDVGGLIGSIMCSNAHPDDFRRCIEAAYEAKSGNACTVDYRIDNGNNNIINSCTFRHSQEQPTILAKVSSGYA